MALPVVHLEWAATTVAVHGALRAAVAITVAAAAITAVAAVDHLSLQQTVEVFLT